MVLDEWWDECDMVEVDGSDTKNLERFGEGLVNSLCLRQDFEDIARALRQT